MDVGMGYINAFALRVWDSGIPPDLPKHDPQRPVRPGQEWAHLLWR